MSALLGYPLRFNVCIFRYSLRFKICIVWISIKFQSLHCLDVNYFSKSALFGR